MYYGYKFRGKKEHLQTICKRSAVFFFYLSPEGLHSSSLGGWGIQVGILNVVKDLVGTHKSPYEGESIFVEPGRAKQGQIFV